SLCSFCACVILLLYAPAPSVILTLSLHDALPIWSWLEVGVDAVGVDEGEFAEGGFPAGDGGAFDEAGHGLAFLPAGGLFGAFRGDRKSTRLNSSHVSISYAVFCLNKKFISNCCIV